MLAISNDWRDAQLQIFQGVCKHVHAKKLQTSIVGYEVQYQRSRVVEVVGHMKAR